MSFQVVLTDDEVSDPPKQKEFCVYRYRNGYALIDEEEQTVARITFDDNNEDDEFELAIISRRLAEIARQHGVRGLCLIRGVRRRGNRKLPEISQLWQKQKP